MHPVLIQIGPITLHTYGTLLAVAVLLGLWLARRNAMEDGLDGDRVWNLGVYAVLAGLVVAKVWLIFADWGYYMANPREIFALSTLQSGGTFYGGVLGALVMVLVYARYAKLPFLPLADAYAPCVALGAMLGRLGCFSAGCCYGKATQVAWGVTFTSQYAHDLVGTPLNIRLHPTQLYDSFAAAGIFIVLLLMRKRRRFTGQLWAMFMILYGAMRFTTEFFRGDPGRTELFGGAFSLMQVVSVLLILSGVWLWWRGAAQSDDRVPHACPER
ncbi:MAG TPA: prolipoprotein diacylglyceryl transferase [Candidatus Acidoferrales bacterium]|jgi:phosphatidylglycerol:prolipoprotein diacylglycerol transferase|nr:prolipoprotein diacylglyceryl transferase [Candidatus Acidoferrales bacterium]